MALTFSAGDNALLDRVTPTLPLPDWMTTAHALDNPQFLDTYLAYRTPPRSRPDPQQPYAFLDVLVGGFLKSRLTKPLSAAQLLDVALLFPPSVAGPILNGREPDLRALLFELCGAVENCQENVADGVDVLAALARSGVASLVREVLGNGELSAAETLRRWCVRLEAEAGAEEELAFVKLSCDQIERISSGSSGGASFRVVSANGGSSGDVTSRETLSPAEAAVRGMLPDSSVESIRSTLSAVGGNADAAVWMLLNGDGVHTAIGKRTGRRRAVKDVRSEQTFSGEAAVEDGGYGWLKTRMDAEIARQAAVDPDDPREDKQRGAYSYLLDGVVEEVETEYGDEEVRFGMYDDDADDAVLEGEEPLGEEAAAMAKSMYVRGAETGLRQVDRGSSTEEDEDIDGSDNPGFGSSISRGGGSSSTAGTSTGRGGRGRGRGSAPAPGGGGARGRGRGRGGSVDGGSGSKNTGEGSRGSGHGRVRGNRGRGGRGRGGRGGANHGRRDGALKKQSRAGM